MTFIVAVALVIIALALLPAAIEVGIWLVAWLVAIAIGFAAIVLTIIFVGGTLTASWQYFFPPPVLLVRAPINFADPVCTNPKGLADLWSNGAQQCQCIAGAEWKWIECASAVDLQTERDQRGRAYFYYKDAKDGKHHFIHKTDASNDSVREAHEKLRARSEAPDPMVDAVLARLQRKRQLRDLVKQHMEQAGPPAPPEAQSRPASP